MERKRRIIPRIYLLLTLLTLAACATSAVGQGLEAGTTATSEMWIELSEPVATADLSPEARAERMARIDAEQARLVARLDEMGIETVTRLRQARNAVLVIMSPQQADAVARLSGVRRIVPAVERRAPEIHAPDPSRG